MRHIYFSLIVFAIIGFSCSTGKKALERGDYFSAVSKAVDRLKSDPDNKNATRVLKDGYPMAIKYYQQEIDLILTGDDQFKWNQTMGIMEKVNRMASMIRKVPAAWDIVPNAKVYTEELRPAKERAAGENYQAGLELMEGPSREAAREAHRYFRKADKQIPGYEDVNSLLVESKDKATYKVVVEQVPVYTERYTLAADFFYDRVMGMLKYNFPPKGYVNFYSVNEANNYGIEHPDMVLKMNFYDFHIGRMEQIINEEPLEKVVEEKVKVKSRKDTTIYETRVHRYKGKIKVFNDQIFTEGILNVEINDFNADETLLHERIPGQFVWNNSYGIFIGDREVLDPYHLEILNNQAYPPPPPQDLFIEFTVPIYEQLTSRLKSFYRKYK